MFRKLKIRFVATTMIIATLILGIAFTVIYIICAVNTNNRPQFSQMGRRSIAIDTQTRIFIEERLAEEASDSLSRLLLTLIFTAISAEALVFLASCYIAEQSIKPIRRAYEAQKDFIAGASHELKTPVATIRANFEALNTTSQPWTDNINSELDKSTALINDLLALSKSEDPLHKLEEKSVDIVRAINNIVRHQRPRLEGKKLDISLPAKYEVLADEQDFRQCFGILLDNAIKYSDQYVAIDFCDGVLYVANDGRGISKSALPHVFEKFYQADKTAEGAGLGLAIAWAVAERHGWRLGVESGGGKTVFSLGF